MKKIFNFIIYSSLFLYAGNVSSQVKYDKGDILLNGGIGVGYYYGNGGLPIFVSGEYAITDAISVGPYLAYTSKSYSNGYFGYSWKYRYTFIDFGARGAYHYGKHLNLRTDKLDLYGGVFLGYITAIYRVVDTPAGFSSSYYNNNNAYASTVRAGVFAGARYYFTEQFAAMGEVGYGIAPLSLGVTFNF
jgi:hypothetical protein